MPARPGDRWFVDETYVKIVGRWVYLYRAIDQFGQVIDVLVSGKRDGAATRRFFIRALKRGVRPAEVITDKAAVYPVGAEPVLHVRRPGHIRGSIHRADRDVEGEAGVVTRSVGVA